uniref:Uncharacterized protein n=1 Tax=Sphenodon punctatus TaxID=8508 RepID=A0A8D0GVG9_SPHPU
MDCSVQMVSSTNVQPYGPNHQGGPSAPYSSTETTLLSGSPVEQPRDFVVWSLFNTIFCNCCCLGFLALVFSVKARDHKVIGDINSASSYGKTAKCLNITNVVIVTILIIVTIIVVAVIVSAASKSYHRSF